MRIYGQRKLLAAMAITLLITACTNTVNRSDALPDTLTNESRQETDEEVSSNFSKIEDEQSLAEPSARETLTTVEMEVARETDGELVINRYLPYDQMYEIIYTPFTFDNMSAERLGFSLPVVDGDGDGYSVDGIIIEAPTANIRLTRYGMVDLVITIEKEGEQTSFFDTFHPGPMWYYLDNTSIYLFYTHFWHTPHDEFAMKFIRIDLETASYLQNITVDCYGAINDVRENNGRICILYESSVSTEFVIYILDKTTLSTIYTYEGSTIIGRLARIEIIDGVLNIVSIDYADNNKLYYQPLDLTA